LVLLALTSISPEESRLLLRVSAMVVLLNTSTLAAAPTPTPEPAAIASAPAISSIVTLSVAFTVIAPLLQTADCAQAS
jgi:hypothetical protein